MRVLDRSAQRIDLSNQGGALTVDVLQHLRNAMRLNDYYIHLSLSYNALHDDELAVISAIIKEKASLESLELCDCGLNNKSINFYLFPALMLHHSVIRLDLSKNELLTDDIAESLCNYIAISELTELNLMGVPLSRVSGAKITHAMEHNNTTLLTCQLPYTVGFHNLDKAAAIVERNKLSAQYHHSLPAITRSCKVDKREQVNKKLMTRQSKETPSLHNDECTGVLPETISWGKCDNKPALHDNYCSTSTYASKHLNSDENIRQDALVIRGDAFAHNDMHEVHNWSQYLNTNPNMSEATLQELKEGKHQIALLNTNTMPLMLSNKQPLCCSNRKKINTNSMIVHNINKLTNMKSHFLPPLLTQVQMPNFSIADNIGSKVDIINNNSSNIMNNINTNKSSIRVITQWADPTLQRTLVQLQTLHDRCALYDYVMAEQQRRLASDQGLVICKKNRQHITKRYTKPTRLSINV